MELTCMKDQKTNTKSQSLQMLIINSSQKLKNHTIDEVAEMVNGTVQKCSMQNTEKQKRGDGYKQHVVLSLHAHSNGFKSK